MPRRYVLFVLLFVGSFAAPRAPASTEGDLNRTWNGSWVVVGLETYSACERGYTDNEVRGDRVVGRGPHPFDSGELAVVHKIRLRRTQVEVLLDLVEPLLVEYQDGPFTLYRQATCKVELEIPVPRGIPFRREVKEIDTAIARLLDHHPTVTSAQRSPGWNGRVVEAFPADYQETLFEYQLWKSDQVNGEIHEKRNNALANATRRLSHMDDDPEYLAGFAEGVEEAGDEHFGNCDALLSMSVYSFTHDPPQDRNSDWQDGYQEGQELVFYVELAHRLGDCFIPPPPPPAAPH